MFTTKHNPHGGDTLHCDNDKLEEFIASYQTQGDSGSLSEIIRLTQDGALTLIRFHKTTRYGSEDELLSDVNFKRLRAVDKFDPAKGSAFTFLSRVVTDVRCTSVSNARKSANRCTELDQSVLHALPAKVDDRSATDDITHRIRAGAKTTLTDPVELSTQRWYIESFYPGWVRIASKGDSAAQRLALSKGAPRSPFFALKGIPFGV